MKINYFHNSNVNDNIWQVYTDIECEHCGKLNPMSSYACIRCGLHTEYEFVMIKNVPIGFNKITTAKQFENEYDAFIVAAELFGYNTDKMLISKKFYGSRPYVVIKLKNGDKKIELYIFLERSEEYESVGAAINYGGKLLVNKELLDKNYIESDNLSLVFERLRRDM